MGTKIAGEGASGEDAVARALSLVVIVWASVVLPGGLLVVMRRINEGLFEDERA